MAVSLLASASSFLELCSSSGLLDGAKDDIQQWAAIKDRKKQPYVIVVVGGGQASSGGLLGATRSLFNKVASDKEIAGLFRAVGEVARQCGVAESGYRIIANAGQDGHQEVPHLHFHVVGGAPSGPMLKRLDS